MRTDLLWAKTTKQTPLRWHPLPHHLLEAAATGLALWTEWASLPLAQQLAAWLGSPEAAESFVAWLCGVHDLGKASPAFQLQVPDLAREAGTAGLPFSPLAQVDRAAVPHAVVSALAVRAHLCGAGWPQAVATAVGELVGGHHGRFPSGWVDAAATHPHVVGTGPWERARAELAQVVAHHAGFDAPSVTPSGVPGPPVRLALAGLISVADWLASDASRFPYDNSVGSPASGLSLTFVWARARKRTVEAVAAALSPGRWHAVCHPDVSAAFAARFPHRGGPRPLQAAALEAARSLDGPGILIVEGPTGEGKTEAALVAAEELAATTGADGLFFALPTRATGNQMFARLTDWLMTQPGSHAVALAHAQARLEPAYAALLAGGPADVGRDEPADPEGAPGSVVATEWLAGRRRSLLARFVAGTVDQLLYAALASRFVALRHLGLAGKVVVVDEVHAYDAYMSVFLRRALQWLGAAGVPVVLVSATLTADQRRGLLAAYLGKEPEGVDLPAYPAVLAAVRGGQEAGMPTSAFAAQATVGQRRLAVELVEEPDDAGGAEVAAILRERLADGGCALVLRNTVRRAQDTWRALRSHLGDCPVELFHSRFAVADRRGLERRLVERFGAAGDRPERFVLVATQVVEQSLDVDFDLLVTDLAPVDLLLQRAGRIHRHQRGGRPAGVAAPAMVVCGWRDGPDGPVVPAGSRRVYGEHSLVRTWAVLRDRCGAGIKAPDDLPALLEAVYGPNRHTPADLGERLGRLLAAEEAEIEQSRAQAHQFALGAPPARPDRLLGSLFPQAVLDGGDDDPVARAAVRAGEPGVQVVLVAEGEEPAGDPASLGDPACVAAVLDRVVTLPPYLPHDDAALVQPAGWARHPWLRHLRTVACDPDRRARIGAWRISYSSEEGLRVERE